MTIKKKNTWLTISSKERVGLRKIQKDIRQKLKEFGRDEDAYENY